MMAARRLVTSLAVAGLGWALAALLGAGEIYRSDWYLYSITALLGVGLFSSTSGIAVGEVRHNVRLVLVAVTVGVLAKAALISGVMYLAFGSPAYLVLGVAVAQIDPLSVAAMSAGPSRMSPSARAILAAWASFDDPVTTLLTIYLSTFALAAAGGSGPGLAGSSGDLAALGTGLAANLVFVVVAFACWRLLGAARRRAADRVTRSDRAGWVAGPLTVGVLLVLGALAVWQFWMLGLALTGLFFRPAIARALGRLTDVAFLVATFALGLILVRGFDPLTGAVLGSAAFGAQIVVALCITRRLPAVDRTYLALGQQNGITAIILALLLEPSFPATVGIVAPAILTVNLLHTLSNAVWDAVLADGADRPRRRRLVGLARRSGQTGQAGQEPAPAPAGSLSAPSGPHAAPGHPTR